MSDILKPCPSCGNEKVETKRSYLSYWVTKCYNGECPCLPEMNGRNEKDSKRRWNNMALALEAENAKLREAIKQKRGEMTKSQGLQMKYFVLSPLKNSAYGRASRGALLAYATIIEPENFELAKDLRHWAYEIQEEYNERSGG